MKETVLQKAIAKKLKYNRETGKFIYHGVEVENPAQTIPLYSGRLTLNQAAYVIVIGEPPTTRLTHIDKDPKNFKWSNIKGTSLLAATKDKMTTKLEMINGKMMSVSTSPASQPNTEANKKRMSGECVGCAWYINRCLEKEMKVECLGYKVDQSVKRKSKMLTADTCNLYKPPAPSSGGVSYGSI